MRLNYLLSSCLMSVCRAVLVACLLPLSAAYADTLTIPATIVYRGSALYQTCAGPSTNVPFEFASIEEPGPFIAARKASASLCSQGQIWYYDYVSSTEVSPGSWQVYGRSQYNGDIHIIGTFLRQYNCLPQTNVGSTTCPLACPNDQISLNGVCQKPKLDTCPDCGNPIAIASGNKFQIESDYRSSGNSPLGFTRYYNSIRLTGAANPTYRWRNTYQRRIITGTTFDNRVLYSVERPNSDQRQFVVINNVLQPRDAEVVDSLTRQFDASNNPTGFRYVNSSDDSVEMYDTAGRLLSIASRSGIVQTLTYSDASTPANIAPKAGLLIRVDETFGHAINFTYDAQSRLSGMTDPNGGVVGYGHDANGNLVSVTFPDTTGRQYLYNEAAFTTNTNLPNALTGIVDENNVRFATFSYDTQGRGISTEHAGGVEKHQITYPSAFAQSISLDPLGTSRTFNFSTVLGLSKNTSRVQSLPGGGTATEAKTYDSNGNMASRTDFNGNRTNYAYDLARNLETSRTEGLTASGATTAQTRTITMTWHPTFRIPATITEPTAVGSKVTTYGHDANGNVLSKSVAVAGVTRSWSWTYDQYGRVLTATDPRLNTSTNTYYANDAGQGTKRGMLNTITNAAGHTTTITSYNAHGQPLSITDANGLVTDMVYDPRQRLTSRTVGGETTVYNYDGVGQLKKVTLPDNSYLEYNYDGAHRLNEIKDSLNNRVVYTLDNMGNRTKEEYADPSNQLARTRTRVYDALNRLQRDIGGETPSSQITQYGYDNNGNQTSTLDPLSRTTTQSYDALNRLMQVVDPFNGAAAPTKYEYDAQDNLTKVTDPKNLSTVYVYNGFNELTSQTSPDTGATGFTYDAAGNLATKTDARGVTATYSYDTLNRVSTISYPAYGSDPAETVTYTYDSCSNGKGRLCSITDKTGTTVYSYNTHGRLLGKAQTTLGFTQTVSYSYNAAGQMDRMTLPSGKAVTYAYLNNRIAGVTYDGKPVIKNADYEPFGPVGEWTWGNDTTTAPNKHTRYFDLDGRVGKIESGNGIDPSLIIYDAASRITALQKMTGAAVDPAKSTTYGYDSLDRLTAVTPNVGNPNPMRGFTYDGVGNRVTSTVAGSTTNYGYGANSHRLNSLTGAITKSYSYDADGNRINDGTSTWNYGGNNRPTVIALAGTSIQAGINALGQRVTKTVNGTVTRFMYDEAGRLIGEYDLAGKARQETLWFNDLPVAVIK